MARNRNRASAQSSQTYMEQVVSALKQNPNAINVIKANCQYYQEQAYLKKGLKRTIEHLEWVLAADDNIERICQQIMADDHIGNKCRQYPLLFKGVTPPKKNRIKN
ncbi:hypothetical protein [Pseudoalteromonas luteoviolacea]|uniref:Uncharacterized protein n=1 Tax=Pseudoalteromonas luteoviolacea S4054 TaxID=1129367 RepID=A0A0F6A5V7_9GAMM|nr:hypothetical protein [Pseudoalteromonas luteoviolacea]AOT10539.1 hypothetical protein S4054249_22000 [Pseudoalteromonas luteoviolacea]AOT15393.1 hypothetical protein S40542_21595 [Pseudoalteromonas luteoviolacea]AOT20358.1 hypothetical protein S4054_21915 [Pseudoalteromonas luteoviolacea]KKE81493.1 hypothetical protein N479_03135 [Pseudoalteromonas luteoviolacea S4054]KZN71610.1 hypothetical protein N481_18245 [Pseudoalteromonas luteoviolacea S4047-1]